MYETFSECLAAFLEVEGHQKAIHDGVWEWVDRFGVQHTIQIESAKRKIRKMGVWAFTQDKKTIHLWIKDATVPLSTVVAVIAHEMAHIKRPWHRSFSEEEQKACEYEDVAYNATIAAELIIEKVANDGR